MAALRIYTDEKVDHAVVAGLRRRGVDAWSASDAQTLGTSDEKQLAYATSEQSLLFTHDVDLVVIARDWIAQGLLHYGVI